MSQNLPAIQAHIGLPDRAAIQSFLDELEAVAESCTVVSPAVNPAIEPEPVQVKRETYLDEIASKYSFASPRSSFYNHEEAPVQPHSAAKPVISKPIVPSGLMWQFNKTYRALLNSISTIKRRQ